MRAIEWKCAVAIAFALAATAIPAGAATLRERLEAVPERIVLVARPPLRTEPGRDNPVRPAEWAAGQRVEALEIHAADRSTERALDEDAPGTKALDLWVRVRSGGREGWLPDAWLALPPAAGEVDLHAVDRFSAIPPDYEPADLVPVGPGYDREVNYRLRRDAAAALRSMLDAAGREGIQLKIVSAYRSWATQQGIYARKLRQGGWDQQTVARPGHSEHQLGTAVDLTDGDEKTLLRASFADTPAGRWLRENAWVYGFAQSYTDHNRAVTGYAPEPWHYRYWGIAQARRRHLEALGEAR